ncbi:hypothetical protein L0337_41975 [candidate division KSB1 bacterium]|nr:hypothetical protein [candidate division KSB1 bacterium]
MKHLLAIPAMIGAVLAFSLAGCGKDSMSSKGGSLRLSIRAMSGSLPKTASPQAQQVTITSAKVVLGEIEIENSSEDSMDFKSNTPLVVNLDLSGAPTNLGTVSIPYGTYEELEYEITKLTPQDTAVYNANPDLQGYSLSIRGYVDGDTNAVFTFKSAIEVEQEQEFSPPLGINDNSPQVVLMISIDTRMWFSDGAGTYLDPRDPQNQQAIEWNLRASINAYQDNDNDGDDDNDADDDDGGTDDDDD